MAKPFRSSLRDKGGRVAPMGDVITSSRLVTVLLLINP